MKIQGTPTPIDLPAQEKTNESLVSNRKEAINMIKEDVGLIRNLDEPKMVLLAELLHFAVDRKSEAGSLERLVQLKRLMNVDHGRDKAQLVVRFLDSVVASKGKNLDAKGAQMVNDLADVVLADGEQKLVRALAEVTRSIIRMSIDEGSDGESVK